MNRQALLIALAAGLLAASAAMGAAPVYEPSSDKSTRQMLTSDSRPPEDLSEKVRLLEEELQTLRGMLEETSHQLTQLNDRQRDLYSDLDSRLNELKPGAAPTAVPPPSSAADDYSQYQSAYDLLQQKRYNEAVKAFDAYVKAHPKGQYAANAYYWMGETHIIRDDLNQARSAFSKIVSDYPGHAKSGDALLKLGYVYDAAGEKQKAIKTLTEVKSKYPSSNLARKAQERLSQIQDRG